MAYYGIFTAIAADHAHQLTDAIFQLPRFRITDDPLVRIRRYGTSLARNSAKRLSCSAQLSISCCAHHPLTTQRAWSFWT